MKKSILKLLCFFSVFFTSMKHLSAQETNEATLKSLLTTKSFIFKAQSAWPLQGTVVQLNGGFDMRIMQDSINTYLPYFGRAYTAGYASTDGGISFISRKFEYKLKDKQKDGWEIMIKPADAKDINQLIYSVSINGFATLQVLCNNRQPISFYGVIEKR